MKLTLKVFLASALIATPLAMAGPFVRPIPGSPITRGVSRSTNEHRAEARFSSATSLASGKSRYRERARKNTIEQRFRVEVEDATPGDSLAVMVNGAMFGTIIVNDLGMGGFQFRTVEFIDDPGDGDPIPTEFPRIDPGATISVGDMSGTFR